MRIQTVLPIVPLLFGVSSLAVSEPAGWGPPSQGEERPSGVDAGALVDQAFDELGEKRFSAAAALLQRAGDDATARYLLGCIHEYGSLGKADDRVARKHYEVAVQGNCPDAARALVRIARRGDGASTAAVQHWLYEAFKLGDDSAAMEISREYSQSGRTSDGTKALAWARIAKESGVIGADALEADMSRRFPNAVNGASVRQRMIERKLERERESIDGVVQIQVPEEMFLPAGSGVPQPASAFEAADALYAAGDYRGALRGFLPLAEEGHGAAAFYVGRMYEMGYVGPANAVEAERWYLRASEAGIGTAMENLGLMVLQGRGLAKDPTRATDLLMLAAYAGNPGGATNVGFAYLTGQGRAKDMVEGWAWTAIAADLNQDNAESNLRIGEAEMTAAQKAQARQRKERLTEELQGREKPARVLPDLPEPSRSIRRTGEAADESPTQDQGPAQNQTRGPERGLGSGQARGLGRGAPAAGAPRPPVQAASAPKGTVRMNQVGLQDELMGNMKSHTMLLPEGWNLTGGVTWNPLSTWAYVSVDARAGAPDGRHVQFLPNGSFTYYEGTQYPGAPQPPQFGQMAGGKMFLPPGEGPTDFVARTLFPAYHPEATDFQIVSVGEVEEVARQYRALFAPIIQQAEAINQQNGGMSGMRSSVNVGCPIVRVSYTEGGKAFEEQFSFMYYRMEFGGDMGMGMSMNTADWAVYDVRGLRAPAGQLDASLPMLQTMSTSLTPTREWKAIVDEIQKQVLRNQREIAQMQHQTNMDNLAALRKRGEIMRRTNAEIMESNQASWEQSQASQDRVSRAWSNTMLGVDDYKLPDGSVRSLDSSYNHVYTTGGDSFLFTDDANFNPNIGSTLEWQRVEPITPMGGAANR